MFICMLYLAESLIILYIYDNFTILLCINIIFIYYY